MHTLILGFITAFVLTYVIIPVIIGVARQRKFLALPNERSSHEVPTPSLGGIGIFAGTIVAVVLWAPFSAFAGMQHVLAAFVLIFLIGVLDDVLPLSPVKKFAGQLLVSVILAYKSNIRLTSFYGAFGILDIPELTSFVLSVVAIVGIINAFNLIDGINGLAGSIGLLACVAWGIWFGCIGAEPLSIIAFSLAGAIVAFLKYNFTPARIFMGDTGSLLIGTVCAILAIKFIEINYQLPPEHPFRVDAAPSIAVAVLILPIFDTLRVFVRRIVQGRSPFSPDKSHIHHLLLDLGLSHMQSTAWLVLTNVVFVAAAVVLNHYGMVMVLLLELAAATGLTALLQFLKPVSSSSHDDAA
ncbi:MAG TPA: MraY family glycosyltransferase [Saprospiraceae bacterium]|nr:MraY family glycosyltransferase [Saprospiraceae bacterium]